MTATQSSNRGRAIFWACILFLAAATGHLVFAKDARMPANAYLDALQGDWDMTGTLLGKPVKYHARGQRVLYGGFLRLHMIDAAAPPTYEAIESQKPDGGWSTFATYSLAHAAPKDAH